MAQKYVASVRARAACELCGAQPVEWHHPEGQAVSDYNHSISRLATRGSTIERIAREIASCEALCRSCHMEVDGRKEALAENRPFHKGDIAVPQGPGLGIDPDPKIVEKLRVR